MSIDYGPHFGIIIDAPTGAQYDAALRAFLRAFDAVVMLAVINPQPTARTTNISPLPAVSGRRGHHQCNRYPAPIPAA